MPLNIKNEEVERLVADIASITGESKTEAVRKALAERRARLAYQLTVKDRAGRIQTFLEQEVWPIVPEEELGRKMSTAEEDALLGYGADGL